MQIGQILSQSVPLSDHDLEEILHEQKATRQRFGEVALSLGKAQPQQVWDAWLVQIQEGPIDLAKFAPDAAAIAAMPARLAAQFGVVPLRVRGAELVVAAANPVPLAVIAEMSRRCGLRLIVGQASPTAVAEALALLYPAISTSAA